MKINSQIVLFLASAIAALSVSQSEAATFVISSGSYIGTDGITAALAGGDGTAGLYITQPTRITGGIFRGGAGGTGTPGSVPSSDPNDPTGTMVVNGNGGAGAAGLSISSTSVEIWGGDFNGGKGGYGQDSSNGFPGVAGYASPALEFYGSTLTIRGGSFTIGAPGQGSVANYGGIPSTFGVYSSNVIIDGDFGIPGGTTYSNSITLTGKLANNSSSGVYSFTLIGSGASVTVIPEPSALLLSGLGALALLRRRRN